MHLTGPKEEKQGYAYIAYTVAETGCASERCIMLYLHPDKFDRRLGLGSRTNGDHQQGRESDAGGNTRNQDGQRKTMHNI